MTDGKLKLVILGGLDGIGKNMMALEYNGAIIVIDAGMMFPDADMYGVDKVIPDLSYIRENREKVKAVILTHGHEDHIGALSNLFAEVSVPIYGTRLTLALAESRLKKGQYTEDMLKTVKPGQRVTIEDFKIEFIRVSHSIPDGVALNIATPVGTIVHTGDFKIDHTPIDGRVADLNRFAKIGAQGVLALLSDSTNADTEGFALSERVVGETFDRIFRKAALKRVIVVTFASNIHRIQQVISTAHTHGRKVCVIGKSMEENVAKAHEYGYLSFPEDTVISFKAIHDYTPEETVIVTTGSQGEPMSVIARMARENYRGISVGDTDCVVLSAAPIPGNEKGINKIVNQLCRRGAEVIYEENFEVHVSGHACQEELSLMLNLVRPRYFIPIHGEYRHLVAHASLAESVGVPTENIFVLENGEVLEFDATSCVKKGTVPGGSVLIDGLAEDEPYNIVQVDRRMLSRDGILIVSFAVDQHDGRLLSEVKVNSRGFIYMKEAPELREGIQKEIERVIESFMKECKEYSRGGLKKELVRRLTDFTYTTTKRRPILLPVILEI